MFGDGFRAGGRGRHGRMLDQTSPLSVCEPIRPALAVMAILIAACSFAAPPGVLSAPPASRPQSLRLEDPSEPLTPRVPKTEEEEDHLHALAHFSTGRALVLRKQPAKAIGHYQRALRYDPAAKDLVWTIVMLAEQLKWDDVRDRYLLKAAKLDPDSLDPADLIDIVDLVNRKDEIRLMVRLFERAIAERKNHKKTPLDIVLPWRLAEIHIAAREYAKAADCAAVVLQSLEHPKQYGLSTSQFEQWFGLPHPPYWLFGEYFFLADRLAEAEAVFRRAHVKKPDLGRLHFQLARINLKRKRPAEALTHLNACLLTKFTEREDLQPYTLLRTVLRRLGRGDELIARLERLRGGDPDNAVLTRFLAQQYLEANRLDQAAKLYESLAKKEPDSQILAALLKIYRKQGKITSLLRGLGQAVGRSASLDGLGGQVGAITSDAVLLDKLFAEASKRFAAGPGSLGPYAPLAVALLAGEAKRNDLVESFFESAILAAPEHVNDTLLLWGGSLMAKDQFAKAAKVFRRGAMSRISDNDKAMFYYYLASALELGGQTDEALKAARKAQKLNHHSPLLASHEAWVLYHAGRTGEAGEAYERVIDRFRHNHTSPGIRQILREARFILSHLEIERGDKQRAAEWLEEVLDEFPNDISAMNDLGYLWADQGIHTQRALRMIRRAADAEPDNPAYQDSLGWALYRVGRLQEAVIVLEKAAAMLPDGEVYDHLGEVYLKLGKTRDAADTWRKSIEAYRSADQPENAKTREEKLRKIDPNRGHAGAMEKTKSP